MKLHFTKLTTKINNKTPHPLGGGAQRAEG